MSLPRRRKPQETVLGSKAKALQATEDKLRRQKEELERLVREAPRLKEEEEKRRREAAISRHRRTGRSLDAPTLIDKRQYHTLNANVTVGPRSLRRERKEAQMRTLWLCLLLFGVLALLWLKLQS